MEIGHTPSSDGDFSFDNEPPRHQQWLGAYRLADRLVTNGEWLEFMEDGGYRRAELWLCDGWGRVNAEGSAAPFYLLFAAPTVDRHCQEDHGLAGGARISWARSWRFVCRICCSVIGVIGQVSIRTWRPSKAT